jgi:hypothetical protein
MFSEILRRHSLRRRLTHFNEIGAIAESYGVNECLRLWRHQLSPISPQSTADDQPTSFRSL